MTTRERQAMDEGSDGRRPVLAVALALESVAICELDEARRAGHPRLIALASKDLLTARKCREALERST